MHSITNIFTKEKSISSLEVAEMMETEHWKLLRKLEGDQKSAGIIKILTDNNFVVSDYFILSSYKDSSYLRNMGMKCPRHRIRDSVRSICIMWIF